MLAAHHLTKRYANLAVVDDVSLDVAAGALVGLIGTNGAGKSTAFSIITGFEKPEGGIVKFDGRDIMGLSPQARVRAGLGRTFQIPREFRHLTVRENIMAAAPDQLGERLLNVYFRAAAVREQEEAIASRADELLAFLNLAPVALHPSGTLSGGQKKLLELGRILMVEPKMILLDEPFAGVHPVLIEELAGRIRELNARGIAFLIVEHNLEALSRLVSEIYVMDRGAVIAHGAPDAVLNNESVREAYMGGLV